MANALFGFPNQGDAATLSGGSWSASLPITNLQDRVLAKKARSADLAAASTIVIADLGRTRQIRIAALIAHNLSMTALYRVTAANASNFATLVADSGWLPVWPAVYPSGALTQLEWEDDNWWTGQYTAEQVTGVNWNLIHVFNPAYVLARYWKIELSDPLNANGFVEAGRLFLAPAWQPAKNFSYGASLGWESNTQIDEALGGTEYFDRRTPYRVQRLSLDWLTTEEGLVSAYELIRRAGIDGEVLFVRDPDDTLHAIRRQFLGRLRQLSPLEDPYFNTTRLPLEIKELL